MVHSFSHLTLYPLFFWKTFIPIISALMSSSWLELEQPVELVKNIFVDAYLTNRWPSSMMGRTHWSNCPFLFLSLFEDQRGRPHLGGDGGERRPRFKKVNVVVSVSVTAQGKDWQRLWRSGRAKASRSWVYLNILFSFCRQNNVSSNVGPKWKYRFVWCIIAKWVS